MIEKEEKKKKVQNPSVVDEFNKNKRLFFKMKFKVQDIDYLWNCFLTTFKKTFRINRELELGLKFSLRIGGINSSYQIETFDIEKRIVRIEWNNNDDKYWMKFYLRKKFLFKGCVIKVSEHIYRSTPFWGLQDTAGLIWMKRNFKKEMKRMKQSILIVVNNGGNVPDELEKLATPKTLKLKLKFKNNNFETLVSSLQTYFKNKINFENNKTFTTKINKYSIVYNIKDFDTTNGLIILNWNQDSDNYNLKIKKNKNAFVFEETINSIWDVDSKNKLKLIKLNLKEMIKELKKCE